MEVKEVRNTIPLMAGKFYTITLNFAGELGGSEPWSLSCRFRACFWDWLRPQTRMVRLEISLLSPSVEHRHSNRTPVESLIEDQVFCVVIY